MKFGAGVLTLDHEEEEGIKFKPDNVSAVALLNTVGSPNETDDIFNVAEDETPNTNPLPIAETSRASRENQIRLLCHTLESKGYKTHLREYAAFFIDYLNTAKNIKDLIPQNDGTDPRVAFFEELSKLEKIKTHFGAVSGKADYLFEHNDISDNISKFYLEKLFQDEKITALLYGDIYQRTEKVKKREKHSSKMSNAFPRCMTFLPLRIDYTDGTAKIITLVSISGLTKAQNPDDSFYKLQEALKLVSEEMHGHMDEIDVSFQYVEHATKKYDWLLFESNRAISESALALPTDPDRECAEKKVFSELVKQHLKAEQNGIISIVALGETNIHFPHFSDWQQPQEQAPESMAIFSKSEKAIIEEELEQLQHTSPFYPRLQNQFDELLKTISSLPQSEDSVANLARDVSFIMNHNEKTKPKAIYTAYRKASEACQNILNTMDAVLLESQKSQLAALNAISIIDLKNYLTSAKRHLKARAKYISANQDSYQTGYYIASPYNPPNQTEGKRYFYPIEYRSACKNCERHKMSYMTLAMHAAGVELSVSHPVSGPVACSSSNQGDPIFSNENMPKPILAAFEARQASSSPEEQVSPIKLSPNRCNFNIKRKTKTRTSESSALGRRLLF